MKSLLVWMGMQLIPVQYSNDIILFTTSDYYTTLSYSGEEAQGVVQALGMRLPTPKIVDAIYKSATCKLRPHPLRPEIPNRLEKHQRILEKQKQQCSDKRLIAGHRKDIVTSNVKARTAIYGWHNLNSKPIQPYSTVHSSGYKDYSQGIRPIFPCFLHKQQWSCDWTLIE